MRAAIYINADGGELGLYQQRERLLQHCIEMGHVFAGFYEGTSQSKHKKTFPPIETLINDAKADLFDVVLIWTEDRLGLGHERAARLADLQAAGVAQHFVGEGLQVRRTPAGAWVREAATAAEPTLDKTVRRPNGRPPISQHMTQAVWESAGTSKKEIAARLGLATKTVRRVLGGQTPAEQKFLLACRRGVLSTQVGTQAQPIESWRVRRLWRAGLINGSPLRDRNGFVGNGFRYTLTEKGWAALYELERKVSELPGEPKFGPSDPSP